MWKKVARLCDGSFRAVIILESECLPFFPAPLIASPACGIRKAGPAQTFTRPERPGIQKGTLLCIKLKSNSDVLVILNYEIMSESPQQQIRGFHIYMAGRVLPLFCRSKHTVVDKCASAARTINVARRGGGMIEVTNRAGNISKNNAH